MKTYGYSSADLEVSVPSRGNGVIDELVNFGVSVRFCEFPSPLGEMGLSISRCR